MIRCKFILLDEAERVWLRDLVVDLAEPQGKVPETTQILQRLGLKWAALETELYLGGGTALFGCDSRNEMRCGNSATEVDVIAQIVRATLARRTTRRGELIAIHWAHIDELEEVAFGVTQVTVEPVDRIETFVPSNLHTRRPGWMPKP